MRDGIVQMKVSHGIFLVGTILSLVLGMMILSDVGNSDHLMYGLVSDDASDKIITLYFFIIIIKFFFAGIVYLFEKGMEKNPLEQYPEKPVKREAKRTFNQK